MRTLSQFGESSRVRACVSGAAGLPLPYHSLCGEVSKWVSNMEFLSGKKKEKKL